MNQVATKTQTQSAVKTALIVWSAGMALALAVAGISARLARSGKLYIESVDIASKIIIPQHENNQVPVFGLRFGSTREDVNINQIKLTFLAEKGMRASEMAKYIKNVKLYKRYYSYNYRYGYGYNYYWLVSNPAQLLLTKKKSKAVVNIPLIQPLKIDANYYSDDTYVLMVDFDSNAPEFNFSVQLAKNRHIKAVGVSSGRKVRTPSKYAKGDWIKVKPDYYQFYLP